MSEVENDAGAWTVPRLLGWTRDFLQRNGVESPRLCAEILLAHAMQCERIRLYTRFEEVPGQDVLKTYRALVEQAATGRPIAHLTGVKEFFSLAFEVCRDVLIPRPETEILVERTIALVRQSPDTLRSICDLGTGSGCVAVSLAKHLPGVRLFASDISESALVVARRNAERNAAGEQIEWRCGDLFEPWRKPGRGAATEMPTAFDVIVCNPPYVGTAGAPLAASVRDFEPPVALFAGPDGLDVIRRILAEAPGWLRAGGHLLLELACDQAPTVRDLLDGAVWQDVVTYRDAAGHERVLHIRRTAAEHPQVA